MTPKEHLLLVQSTKKILQLFEDRDDMLVGIIAALLDLYRIDFREGFQTKAEAIARLGNQQAFLETHASKKVGAKFLASLIASLEADHLVAAKLLRELVAGSA